MAPERGGGGGRSLLPEEPACSTEGLPKAFLQSLRTLFDILDDRRRGYVHLREIESRWLQQGTEARELPWGVLEGLRRAAPASGYLTFERFVLGLRASLLSSDKSAGPAIGTNSQGPGLREEGKVPVAENGLERGGGASRSLEKIPNPRVEPLQGKREGEAGWKPSQNENASKGLVEARRQQRGRCGHRRHTLTNGVDYGMLTAGLLAHPSLIRIDRPSGVPRGLVQLGGGLLLEPVRSAADRMPSICSLSTETAGGMLAFSPVTMVTGQPWPSGARGGHSVVDGRGSWMGVLATYSTFFVPLTNSLHSRKALKFFLWLQQMKELEKEKDFLLQGLEMVEQAREWYHRQIHLLQERQKQLGKSKVHSGLYAEGSLSHLLPKLQELNRCLCELLSLSAKPPNSCSAAVNSPECAAVSSPPLAGPQQTINMLKEQNRLLTKEVTDKSQRITQLEQEKSALIKQLFEARAQNSHETNQLDSTFI